jgi:hypothetical protein
MTDELREGCRFGSPLALLLAGVIGLTVAAPAAAGFTASVVKAVAKVDPCALSVGGRVRRTLRAGVYRISVRDVSRSRYFRLRGPGVSRSTKLAYVGTATWQVRFKRGTYRYRCGLPDSLAGSFTVR